MNITWFSNAPWAPTGYGTQTAQVVKRLKDDGHRVAISANHGLAGRPLMDPDYSVPVFPSAADRYGTDVLRPNHELHLRGEPGWIITLYDVWVLSLPAFEGVNVASWVPIDHYPVPPKVLEWCRGVVPIAMSRFGKQSLAEQGIEADYVPHALEPVWKPTPTLPDGQDVRKAYGIPDNAFLVMINAANKGNMPPRKAWGEMFSALKLVMERHDDVYAYIHTEQRGAFGGVDLPILCAALNIDPDRIRWVDQYGYSIGLIRPEAIAALYTAADVLLASSMGEGFGIPVIEAQACGTPVIVTEFSAQPELLGAGWTVGYQPYWDFTQGAFLALPLVGRIVARLEEAREAKGDEGLRDQALAKAAEYDADRVYAEHWKPVLAKLEAKIRPNRATRRRKR